MIAVALMPYLSYLLAPNFTILFYLVCFQTLFIYSSVIMLAVTKVFQVNNNQSF